MSAYRRPYAGLIVIRIATAGDLGYLARGFAALAAELKAATDNPFVAELSGDPEASTATAGAFLSDPDAFAFIAQERDQPMGSLAARVAPPSVGWSRVLVGHIVCCWVEPQVRNRAIGRRLCEAAEAEFRRREVAYVELSLIVGNRAAEAFWARMGYKPHRVFLLKAL